MYNTQRIQHGVHASVEQLNHNDNCSPTINNCAKTWTPHRKPSAYAKSTLSGAAKLKTTPLLTNDLADDFDLGKLGVPDPVLSLKGVQTCEPIVAERKDCFYYLCVCVCYLA